LDETGTGASSSLHGVPSSGAAAMVSPREPALLSILHISPIPAMKQRRKPTMAVPLFMMIYFLS
jgi:hypothetical protein